MAPSDSHGPIGKRRTGRPSESFPPEHRHLAYEAWPVADRRALEAAIAPPGPFDRPGRASYWRPVTLSLRQRAYSRYLGWLDRRGLLLADEEPADRLTPDRLTGYLREFRTNCSPISVYQSVLHLRLILQAMAPSINWKWVTRHPLVPRKAEVRAASRPKPVFDPIDLLRRALVLMDELNAIEASAQNAALYRDALIAALACLVPLRRGNLAEIELGRHLLIDGDSMRLRFDQTKTGEQIEAPLPPFLQPYIVCYLNQHREILLDGHTSQAFWVNGYHHGPLQPWHLPEVFRRIGIRLIGRPLSAHSLRYAVATALMTRDPRQVVVAAGVLGHRGLQTMTEHYDQSGDAGAQREWRRLSQKARKQKLRS
jgi:integrase